MKTKINDLCSLCYNDALESGWWTDLETGNLLDVDVPLKLVLIHSEISEALEAYRKNLMDDKLQHRSGLEVELSDAIIRIADLAGRLNLDLGGAVMEKIQYNKSRADHKIENRKSVNGKKF